MESVNSHRPLVRRDWRRLNNTPSSFSCDCFSTALPCIRDISLGRPQPKKDNNVMSVNANKHKKNTQDVILNFCNKVAVFLSMIYGFIKFLIFSRYWLDHGFYELPRSYSQIWYIGIWSSRAPLTFDGFLIYSIDKIYAIYDICK